MAGLAVGLVTGRREIVAAGAGRRDRPRRRPRLGPADRGRRGRARRAARRPRRARVAPGAGRIAPTGAVRADLAARRSRARDRGAAIVSVELVGLALLMGAVTYPARALPLLVPGHRAAAAASPSPTCGSSGRRSSARWRRSTRRSSSTRRVAASSTSASSGCPSRSASCSSRGGRTCSSGSSRPWSSRPRCAPLNLG